MEEKKLNSQITERLATETLLQRGVKVKVVAPFFIRWFKKHITLRLYAPYEGTLLRVSAYYLSTGLKDHKINDITVEQSMLLMSTHGKAISKAVACAILNGYWSGKLFTRPFAWYLRWHMTPKQIFALTSALLIYGGASDFMNTTKLVRSMKVTAPNLGQQTPKES